ncbi:DNA-binding protein YbiB [Ramlibacter sp.]|uniref:DNA-binding protein YbiB n=1 Tax=Ramlibacter sp. TaxID=1917967 RepID=UPI002C04BEE3|nr:DNA-binding protein YbiB [Ramlibacter sp.]HWI84423.1 DNA-binding protein YbiB [Ramlibacter sp.]
MGISQYLKQIGRRQGARELSREQAADLFGQVLDGAVSDLEIGAFCLAMRLKGESVDELCGFLDATHARLRLVPAGGRPLVVLPSYNGARKQPVLTPLLALLLAREGLPVLVHGTPTESGRVFASAVLQALGVQALAAVRPIAAGEAAYLPTAALHPGLARLLEARQRIGLRNASHSVVKLMNPSAGAALIVSSYTHAEYGAAMCEVFERLGASALLLRGTEGEAAADARRVPAMDGFSRGRRLRLQERQAGSLAAVPELPPAIDAESTAAYTQDVLAGRTAVPAAIAVQVEHILRLVRP